MQWLIKIDRYIFDSDQPALTDDILANLKIFPERSAFDLAAERSFEDVVAICKFLGIKAPLERLREGFKGMFDFLPWTKNLTHPYYLIIQLLKKASMIFPTTKMTVGMLLAMTKPNKASTLHETPFKHPPYHMIRLWSSKKPISPSRDFIFSPKNWMPIDSLLQQPNRLRQRQPLQHQRLAQRRRQVWASSTFPLQS